MLSEAIQSTPMRHPLLREWLNYPYHTCLQLTVCLQLTLITLLLAIRMATAF